MPDYSAALSASHQRHSRRATPGASPTPSIRQAKSYTTLRDGNLIGLERSATLIENVRATLDIINGRRSGLSRIIGPVILSSPRGFCSARVQAPFASHKLVEPLVALKTGVLGARKRIVEH